MLNKFEIQRMFFEIDADKFYDLLDVDKGTFYQTIGVLYLCKQDKKDDRKEV